MPEVRGLVNFNPDNDIPSLHGKVILVTGGTAGLGRSSIEALAKHSPAHIYFTGRNRDAAERLISSVQKSSPTVPLTFIKMDLLDLKSVSHAVTAHFADSRLDILLCNAGIMAASPGLSKDGYEKQFATNHLGNAMVIRKLLPVLLRTAEEQGSDVRIVSLTSLGWQFRPRPSGIEFSNLTTTQDRVFGPWIRYGQSKLANILYAAEIARQYPQLTAVSVHPGVVATGLVSDLPLSRRLFVDISIFLQRIKKQEPEEGALNQLWAAAGARKSELVNGAFYHPISVLANDTLDKVAASVELAGRLWAWTEEALTKAES